MCALNYSALDTQHVLLVFQPQPSRIYPAGIKTGWLGLKDGRQFENPLKKMNFVQFVISVYIRV